MANNRHKLTLSDQNKVDAENTGPGISRIKDQLSTGRNNRPKRAFGELKNVIHNKESGMALKTPHNIIKTAAFQKSNINGSAQKTPKIKSIFGGAPTGGNGGDKKMKPVYEEDLESIWSQKSALTNAEVDFLLACDNSPKPPAPDYVFDSILNGFDDEQKEPQYDFDFSGNFTAPSFPELAWTDELLDF